MPARTFVWSAILALIAITVSPSSHAANVDISAGRSVTSKHRWTTSAFLDVTTATHTFEGVQWQPAFALGWVQGRRRTFDDMDHDVYIGAAGIRLPDFWRHAFFSFQLAAAAGRTDALSSGGQFVSTLGWQQAHWQAMVRHISNGEVFGGKNLGETMVLVGVRF